jgi:hypothetical protein
VFEREFKSLAEHVLGGGETDDPNEVERRTDAALRAVKDLPSASSRKTPARRSARGTR